MATTVRVLPANPNLEQLKKQAKELLSSRKNGDVSVCGPLRLLKECSNLDDQAILAKPLKLHDAQRALALGYGFESWNAMKTTIENHRLSTSKKALTDMLSSLSDDVPVNAVLLDNHRIVLARMSNPLLKRGIVIQELSEFPLEEGSDVAAELDRVLELQASAPFKGANHPCFFSCPSQSFFVRFLNTDAKGKTNGELGLILEKELFKNVPFPKNDVFWDYDFKVKGDRCEAIFLVHKKSPVLEIAETLSKHGMKPMLFSSSLFSIINSLLESENAMRKSRMFVRVFDKMTELIFFSKENVFLRIIPIGLTSSYVDKPAGVDAILSEIQRSVTVYKKQQNGVIESALIDDALKTKLAELQVKLNDEIKVETEFVELDAFSGAKRYWSGKAGSGALSELAGLALTPTSRATFNLCVQL